MWRDSPLYVERFASKRERFASVSTARKSKKRSLQGLIKAIM
jgi:hypothetical protein